MRRPLVVGATILLTALLLPTAALAAKDSLPGPPTNVQAISQPGGALVSWDAPTNSGTRPIIGYLIKAKPGGLAVRTSNLLSFTTGGLKNGKSSRFTVAAITASGTGKPSTASQPVTPHAATAPGAPTGVTVSPGFQSATISWIQPADGGSPITGFTVTAKPGGLTATTSGDASTLTATGLTNGTTYRFFVTATNAIGTSVRSATTAGVKPTMTVPSSPATVQASPTGSGVAVVWSAPLSDGGSAITGYSVSASPGGATAAFGPSTTTATIGGLSSGTAYTFSVSASNKFGPGPAANSTPATPNITITSQTVVLSSASLAALTSVQSDGTLVFSSPPAQVTSLSTGNIIAAGVSALTPSGLLDEVVSVTTAGSTTTLATTPASLDQAVSDGAFGFSGTLGSDQLASFVPARKGVALVKPMGNNNGLSLNINTVLYQDDNGKTITVTGGASIDPIISAGASFSCCFNVDTNFNASVSEQAGLTLTAQINQTFSGTFPLGTLNFAPIDVQLGPVPVIFSPSLEVSVVANGKVTVGLTTGYHQTASAGVSITTDNADVNASPSHNFSQTFTPPNLYGSLNAAAGVEAKITVTVEGVVGPWLSDTAELEVNASTSANPWWTLDLQDTIGAGIALSAFGHNIVSWSNPNLFNATAQLANAGGSYQQVSITPNPATLEPGHSVQLSAKVNGVLAQHVSWGVEPGGGSISATGVYTAPAVPGDYSVTASASASGLAPRAVGIADMRDHAQPPGAPTNVIAVGGEGDANITWDPPADDGGVPVTDYSVTASPGSATAYGSSPLTVDVASAGTYTFTVTAYTPGGHSVASAPSDPVTVDGSLSPPGMTSATPMPTPSFPGAVLTGPDGRVWTIADLPTSSAPPSEFGSLVQIYDPSTDTWSAGPSLPVGLIFAAGLLNFDGRFYVAGVSSTGQVVVLELESGAWTILAQESITCVGLGPDPNCGSGELFFAGLVIAPGTNESINVGIGTTNGGCDGGSGVPFTLAWDPDGNAVSPSYDWNVPDQNQESPDSVITAVDNTWYSFSANVRECAGLDSIKQVVPGGAISTLSLPDDPSFGCSEQGCGGSTGNGNLEGATYAAASTPDGKLYIFNDFGFVYDSAMNRWERLPGSGFSPPDPASGQPAQTAAISNGQIVFVSPYSTRVYTPQSPLPS